MNYRYNSFFLSILAYHLNVISSLRNLRAWLTTGDLRVEEGSGFPQWASVFYRCFGLLNHAEKERRFYGVRDQEPGTAYR